MVLQIDTSKPLLRPSELVSLVQAIRAAADHDEHHWIEWKSNLDLGMTTGLKHVAKAVVGLANRQPDAAARRAGGYGYLVVGVEPGGLGGVCAVDPEGLVGRVRAIVGDVVRWSPEYVKVDDVDVLVVIVDPPRAGDPIHCVRKQIENLQPGTIFVRHAGRTDPATPADLEMLQARLLVASTALKLDLAAESASVETAPDFENVAEGWATRRRPALLRARYGQREPVSGPWGPAVAQIHEATSTFREAALSAAGRASDKRTEEDYRKEVDEYIAEAKDRIITRGYWGLYRHAPAMLSVRIANPTDVGYTAVRLVVHVPGQVTGYSEEILDEVSGDRPKMPSVPIALGTPSATFQALSWMSALPREFSERPILLPGSISGSSTARGPAFRVTDTGSVNISFREFDIRPADAVVLGPVPLLVREQPETALTATWHATAADMRGRLTGEFELVVSESTIDVETLHHDDAKGKKS